MPSVEYLNYDVVDEEGWNIEDDDLFEKADSAELEESDYGVLEVNEDEYILEAAENQGLNWPFSCRSGDCATCAGVLVEGEVDMDYQKSLSDDEVQEKNIRLTCVGTPVEDNVKIIYNVINLDRDWDKSRYNTGFL